MRRVTSVPRSPGAGRKWTSPSLGKKRPSTDCRRWPPTRPVLDDPRVPFEVPPERAPDLPVHAAFARGRHLGEPGCDPCQGLRIARGRSSTSAGLPIVIAATACGASSEAPAAAPRVS